MSIPASIGSDRNVIANAIRKDVKNIMKKKIAFIILAAAPMILASCQTVAGNTSGSNSTAGSSGDNTSTGASSITKNKDHFNDSYAGYEVDLDGDGTIQDSEKNLTWANSYDKIISVIKKTTDETKRFKLMHAAETELMSTGAICPIYYYTDIFMKKTDLSGFFSMPLGYKFFYGSKLGTSGTFTTCIASAPDTIDPAKNTTVDGGTYDEHLFEGLYRWSYTGTYPNGSVTLVPGLAKAAPAEVENADGTVTYTYTLRDGLKWSDGTALTASDIVRSWKRAVSKSLASDYNYLFEAIKGGADAEGEDDGASLAISATNDTTFVVTLVNRVSYWNELTAFPTFAPVPASADNNGEWVTSSKISSFVGNGPMTIKAFNSSYIELVPNPYYYDQSAVKATDIKFAFSDSDTGMLTSYQKGDYAFIDSVPQAEMDSLQATYPNEFFNVGQLGTYYICWNINSTKFDATLDNEIKRQNFRKALGLLINREYITKSVSKGGEQPANGFVSKGLTGPNGKGDWTDSNGPAQDGSGWYKTATADYAANAAQAINLLTSCGYTYDSATKKFTDIPSFEYIYNTNTNHQAIAETIQAMFAKYGITMTITTQAWKDFVAARKAGSFTVARNGWLCDYNDPISMLDMWISGSGNNDCRFGKSTEKDA